MKLGETNFAKCTKEDLSAVSALDLKNDQAKAKDECAKLVLSTNVELKGDLATKCLDAAEKQPLTSFMTLYKVPECAGILSGKAQEGQTAANAEECASGLSLHNGKCAKPVAENADCGASGGKLGKPEDHPACTDGLICTSLGSESDGNIPKYRCVKPRDIGGNCSINAEDCPADTSCYQGKCRKTAELGEQCMNNFDCHAPGVCRKEGGVFGKCVAPKAAGEDCETHEECLSITCRAKKCLSVCGSG